MVTAVSPTMIKPSDGDKDWGENKLNVNFTNQETFNDQVVTDLGTNETDISNHIADLANPHTVDKTDVGLGNVDNVSDADKPVSTATQTALDLKADKVIAPTTGNFAGLDVGGNITDSGSKSSDFATSAQGTTADSAVQPASSDVLTNKTIDIDNNTLSNIETDNFKAGVLSTGVGDNDKIPTQGYVDDAIIPNTDINAKVSANDTTTNYLENKIVGGTDITVNVLNEGGNEQLEIVATGSSSDVNAKVSANDTTTGYLEDKFVAGTNVTLLVQNEGGNENILISATAGGGIPDAPSDGSFYGREDAGWVNPVKGDVGLGNVDNTSDLSKPISTATQSALDAKADTNGDITEDFSAKSIKKGNDIVTVTVSKILALTDSGNEQRSTSGTAINITVPLNSSVAFPVGTEIPITMAGAGAITVVATGGVTVNTPDDLLIDTQHETATLKKYETDVWSLKKSISSSGGGEVTKDDYKSTSKETNTTTLTQPSIVVIRGDLTGLSGGHVLVNLDGNLKNSYIENFEVCYGGDTSAQIETDDENYSVRVMSYDSLNYDTSTQITTNRSLQFKSDGSKVYILDQSDDTIYQYTLSTPWNISTSSYDSVSFNVTSQESTAYCIRFNSSGSKLYVIGMGRVIYQYTLSTPWDLSTASYDSVSLNVSTEVGSSTGMCINSSNNKIYVVDAAPTRGVYQYNMSTPNDLSTASYSGNFGEINEDTTPLTLDISNGGDRLIMTGVTNDKVYSYDFGINEEVNSLVYSGEDFLLRTQDDSPKDCVFGNSGNKIYMAGSLTSTIYQYSCFSAFSGTVYSSTEYGSGLTKAEYKNTSTGTNTVNVPSSVMSTIFIDTTNMTSGSINVDIDSSTVETITTIGVFEYVYGADSTVEIDVTSLTGTLYSSIEY